jgi:hypothetical protein
MPEDRGRVLVSVVGQDGDMQLQDQQREGNGDHPVRQGEKPLNRWEAVRPLRRRWVGGHDRQVSQITLWRAVIHGARESTGAESSFRHPDGAEIA